MQCHLTKQNRENGILCKSMDCIECKNMRKKKLKQSKKKDKHIEINELISKYHKEGTLNKNLISDKYHTFGELYNHKYHLFIALCKVILYTDYENEKNVGGLAQYTDGNYKCLKSKKHFDGLDVWNEWGMFIVQLETMYGQISYHLPTEYWHICDFIPTLSQANEWDGHIPDDVLERLLLI